MLQYTIHLVYFEVVFKTWEVSLWVPWQITWFDRSPSKSARDKLRLSFLISNLCAGWKQKPFCGASELVHFCSEMVVKICRLARRASKHIVNQIASASYFSLVDVLKVMFRFTVVYVPFQALSLYCSVYYREIFKA